MSIWKRVAWSHVALFATVVTGLALTVSAAEETFPSLVKRLQSEKPEKQDLVAFMRVL
jgi:hypothetical protein